jgi:hypothetical protein
VVQLVDYLAVLKNANMVGHCIAGTEYCYWAKVRIRDCVRRRLSDRMEFSHVIARHEDTLSLIDETMIYQRNPRIEAAPLKNELLLFNGKDNKFFVTNVTAAFLWERLREPASEQTLAAAICASFGGVSMEQAIADVRITVKTMLDVGLLVENDTNATGLES